MNLVSIPINSLSELDFDDLYKRSKDAIDVSWPAVSQYGDEERKAIMIALIESGLNNEWPGLNPHGPNDTYVASKSVDLDTGKVMGLVAGFILEGGIFDGRHALSAADESGSRNYLYSEQFRQMRRERQTSLGITKTLYRNIPADSVWHKSIRNRQYAGHYTILEDVESSPGFRNIIVQYNT